MAELNVKEITELNDVAFTDEALILAYTEADGIGKATFAQAKSNIGAGISIEQTETATASGGTNIIKATVRNGTKTEEKNFTVRNGIGLSAIEQTSTTDSNGLRSNTVKLKSSTPSIVADKSFTVNDGVGIKAHSVVKSTDANGLAKNTLSIAYTDGKTDAAEIKDGVGIKSASQTTASTLSGEKNEFTISLTDGTTKKIQVYNGRAGKDFRIKKTYKSISAMNADFSGADVETFEFAMIDTGSVEDEDTGKLYCKGVSAWSYIGDLSGKQGIKGETGNGIKSVSNTTNANGTVAVTVSMTDGTSKSFTVGVPSIAVASGANIGTVGTPSVTMAQNGSKTTFTFNYLKGATGATGAKGEKGDSVSIPDLVDKIYPVGSLYWSSKNTNPGTLFGGTWKQITDKFVLAAGGAYKAEGTGGAASVALTAANMPSHSHTFTPSGTVSSHSHGLSKATFTGQNSESSNNLWGNIDQQGLTFGWSNNSPYYGFIRYTKAQVIPKGTISGTSDATTPTFRGTQGTTGSSGSGTAFSTMPPYVVKYCWERTA